MQVGEPLRSGGPDARHPARSRASPEQGDAARRASGADRFVKHRRRTPEGTATVEGGEGLPPPARYEAERVLPAGYEAGRLARAPLSRSARGETDGYPP